jgi:predicted alpha/beta hydrolase family esterase
LTPERINALNATEGWQWEAEDPFQDNLDHWITQYRKKGNETPRRNAEDPEEKRACSWQTDMRKAYKKKKAAIMTPERITALNATEGWEWGTQENRNTYSFEEQLTNWITQYRKNGNKTPSQKAKDPEKKRAGRWRSHMRTYYKHTIENKKGTKLTPERINALNATEGWKWDDDPFQDNLDHWITQYRQKGNRTPSNSAEDPEEKRAGTWQSNMRKGYKTKASWLTPERIAALNATEGWKWEEEDTFQDNLDHWIAQYRKKGNKTPRQSVKDPEERRAGRWQSDMRRGYKTKASWLTPERIDALNATEGWKWAG